MVNQLLTEMDGLEARKQVFIMGATNRPGNASKDICLYMYVIKHKLKVYGSHAFLYLKF